MFDKDGSGELDEMEVDGLLDYLGIEVSEDKRFELLAEYDKDLSGKIDYQEFRSMWLSVSHQNYGVFPPLLLSFSIYKFYCSGGNIFI